MNKACSDKILKLWDGNFQIAMINMSKPTEERSNMQNMQKQMGE